jgi:hypothetical protein
VKLKVEVKVSDFLYSDTYRETSDQYRFIQAGRLQPTVARTTDGVARAVAYDRLAPSHSPLQLVSPHAVPLAVQRTLAPSRSWYQFIDL